MTKLKIHKNLSLKNAINFCNSLWKLKNDENYKFNFANLKLIEPFTIPSSLLKNSNSIFYLY